MALLAVVPLGSNAGADSAPQDEFVSGSGRARANLFEILPRTGGLTIPISFGKALVTYQGLSATATSGGLKPPSQNSADPGGCGGGFQPPGGGSGGPPPGAPQPPKPPGSGKGPSTSFPWVSTVAVSTGDKDADTGRHVDQGHFPDNSPISGALERQDAKATADPSGTASTTHARLGFGPVVDIENGRSEATAGVVEHKARLAHAVTTMDRLSLLGGMIVLNDVRWEATQRTGTGARADGSFSVGSVLLNGKPLPALPTAPPALPGAPGQSPPQAPDPLAALNTALAPTGIGLVIPHFEAADAVASVTPMSLQFADSALGRQLLGPIVGDLQPLRDPVVGGLLAASCDFGTLVTVADVATSVLTGSGGISFDFGGVTATTEGEHYDNPFAGGNGDTGNLTDGGIGGGLPEIGPEPATGSALSPPGPEAAAGTATGAGFAPSGGDTGGASNTGAGTGLGAGSGGIPSGATATAGSGGNESAFAPPGVFGATSRHLPGHKGGRGIAVALLALLTTAALAAADAFHLRRASRSIS